MNILSMLVNFLLYAAYRVAERLGEPVALPGGTLPHATPPPALPRRRLAARGASTCA